jgi:Gpi18-like mannosyltransferase
MNIIEVKNNIRVSLNKIREARWFWIPSLFYLITRVGIIIVAYISMPLIADSDVPPYHIKPDNLILDVLGSRWDTGFYISIAEEGYKYEDVEFPSVAFFPLLPLLIRATSVVVGDSLVSGILISNIALLVSMILLFRLVEDEFGDKTATRAIWYMLIFPMSFFGSAIYTESLFLLGAIGSLYLARKGYWESAAMVGILTALTRLMGIIVAPMLFLEWWSQRKRQVVELRPSKTALVAPLVVPLGTLGFMVYLGRVFGDPIAFARASENWGRQVTSPWITIIEVFQQPIEGWKSALLSGRIPVDNLIDIIIVTLFLASGIFLFYRRRWAEGVFVIMGALIPLSSGLLMSQRRYMWVLFPTFILLAQWGKNMWVDRLYTMLSLLGLGLFTAMFANWYWVA